MPVQPPPAMRATDHVVVTLGDQPTVPVRGWNCKMSTPPPPPPHSRRLRAPGLQTCHPRRQRLAAPVIAERAECRCRAVRHGGVDGFAGWQWVGGRDQSEDRSRRQQAQRRRAGRQRHRPAQRGRGVQPETAVSGPPSVPALGLSIRISKFRMQR